MEVASDRSAVREYRTLHQRIIIHELVTNQFLHADPLMECSDRMAAFDVVFRASALFVVHVAVNADVCGIANQLWSSAVEQGVQHVIVAVHHTLHHPRLDNAIMVDEVIQRHRYTLARLVG